MGTVVRGESAAKGNLTMALFGGDKDKRKASEPATAPKGEEMIGGKKNNVPVPTSGELNALLGQGSEFEGKLSFEGTVRIDGTFRGDIQSQGLLMIGESAVVEAEILVDTAVIGGEVRGNITAKSKIELQASARVTGNLSTPALVVKEGARFDGQCQMQNRERPARPVTLLGGPAQQEGSNSPAP